MTGSQKGSTASQHQGSVAGLMTQQQDTYGLLFTHRVIPVPEAMLAHRDW